MANLQSSLSAQCAFLEYLCLDVRFEIYKLVALLESHLNLNQDISILKPASATRLPLTALLSASSQIHEEILLWQSINRAWVSRIGHEVFVPSRFYKYHLAWKPGFGDSFIPTKAMERWHSFCFGNNTPMVGQLIIDFQIPHADVPSAVAKLFSEPYRIERARRKTAVGALPMSTSLWKVIFVVRFNGKEDPPQREGYSRGRWQMYCAWRYLWHESKCLHGNRVNWCWVNTLKKEYSTFYQKITCSLSPYKSYRNWRKRGLENCVPRGEAEDGGCFEILSPEQAEELKQVRERGAAEGHIRSDMSFQ